MPKLGFLIPTKTEVSYRGVLGAEVGDSTLCRSRRPPGLAGIDVAPPRPGRPGYGPLLEVELECSGGVVEVSVLNASPTVPDGLSAAIERRD
jgi:hypothetical protein